MSNTADTAKQLFLDALERSPNERAAYIAKACGDDTAIRKRVEALLDSHQRAERFLEAPAFNDSAATEWGLSIRCSCQSSMDIATRFRVRKYRTDRPVLKTRVK